MKLNQLGWVVAAALGATMFAGGFQAQNQKIGVVDMAKVFGDSDFAKKQSDQLKAFGNARSGILEFLETYRTFTPEQAARFRELSLKATSTAAEKDELEKIKKAVMDSSKALQTLQQKASPTPDETSQLQDLTRRVQTMSGTGQRWAREFDQEIRDLQSKLREDTLDRVRASVKDVGTKGAFTVIFTQDVAPYGANDVTADALKSMNAQRP